jgi:hypothetical protein
MHTPNQYKWLLILSIFKTDFAFISLFKTQDTFNTQEYDCIYYTNVTARNNETIPYCVRTSNSVRLNRSFISNTCQNSGKEWTFKILKQMNISQNEVLTWSSSIDMVDRYAAYLIIGCV